MNSTIWKFRDGASVIECTSFPYAYRTMYQTVRRGLEKGGRKFDEMTKGMSIVSPIKDRFGNEKVYSYFEATQMATNQGLLTPEGTINTREFKRR